MTGRIKIGWDTVKDIVKRNLHKRFSGGPRGAEDTVILFSLIETAKANGLEPYAYLCYLFKHIPLAKTPEDLLALLPNRIDKSVLTVPYV